MVAKCGKPCEVWSRVVGYYRPIANWSRSKKEEFKDRKTYVIPQGVVIQRDDTGATTCP